jgi:hypothetical protein
MKLGPRPTGRPWTPAEDEQLLALLAWAGSLIANATQNPVRTADGQGCGRSSADRTNAAEKVISDSGNGRRRERAPSVDCHPDDARHDSEKPAGASLLGSVPNGSQRYRNANQTRHGYGPPAGIDQYSIVRS